MAGQAGEAPGELALLDCARGRVLQRRGKGVIAVRVVEERQRYFIGMIGQQMGRQPFGVPGQAGILVDCGAGVQRYGQRGIRLAHTAQFLCVFRLNRISSG
ncbi:MAG: hypothetical protein R2911_10330 [Caldilineaceae bacterium]